MATETVETVDARMLTEPDARAIAELLVQVWPKAEKPLGYRMEQLFEAGRSYSGCDARAPRSLIIREAGRVIAHAAVVPRTIRTSAGEMTVLGLARVCSDPSMRGRGLGKIVSQAVFALVDDGTFPFSLFQTSEPVRPFYERLGACAIDNRIIDSTACDKTKPPFTDRVVMRYPNGDGWPEGEIDLCGPGY